MDSLPSISPSIVLPPTNPFRRNTRHLPPRLISTPRFRTRRRKEVSCNVIGGGGGDDGGNEEEVEKALHMDGKIPGSSDEFLKQVSSRAYDMRRNLHQSFDSSSYDGIFSISDYDILIELEFYVSFHKFIFMIG